MKQERFRFKHFSILQKAATHKVGTDGVLLGAWVAVRAEDHRILDIGTGTGLIALMLAQRTQGKACIHAVEINQTDALLAAENVSASAWADQVTVFHTAIQEFNPQSTYDLIVSNPPWFIDSLKPPDPVRAGARHTGQLGFGELLTSVQRLLSPRGRFALVLPTPEAATFAALAEASGLHPLREAHFRSRAEKPVERVLLEFTRESGEKTFEALVLYEEKEEWTTAYQALTRDFYLRH